MAARHPPASCPQLLPSEHSPALGCTSPSTHGPGEGARVEPGVQPPTALGLPGMGGNTKLSGKWPPWAQAHGCSATPLGRNGGPAQYLGGAA